MINNSAVGLIDYKIGSVIFALNTLQLQQTAKQLALVARRFSSSKPIAPAASIQEYGTALYIKG